MQNQFMFFESLLRRTKRIATEKTSMWLITQFIPMTFCGNWLWLKKQRKLVCSLYSLDKIAKSWFHYGLSRHWGKYCKTVKVFTKLKLKGILNYLKLGSFRLFWWRKKTETQPTTNSLPIFNRWHNNIVFSFKLKTSCNPWATKALKKLHVLNW